MLKKGVPLALVALVGGVVGYFLRSNQLNTIFNETTGLADKGATVTIILGIVSVAVFFILVALSLAIPNKVKLSYMQAFRCKQALVPFILVAIAGVGMIIGGVDEMLWRRDMGETAKGTVWGILAVLSGVSIIAGACATWLSQKKRGPVMLTMVPVVFYCVWLLISYMDRASDPVIQSYMYSFFAMGFGLLGFYYIASFAFGKNTVRRMLVCSGSAIYFGIMTLADSQSWGLRVFFGSLALTLLVYSFLLARNASSPPERKTPAPQQQEPEEESPFWDFDATQDEGPQKDLDNGWDFDV